MCQLIRLEILLCSPYLSPSFKCISNIYPHFITSLVMQLFRRIPRLFWSGRIKHYLCWSSSFAFLHSYLATRGVEMVLGKWAVGGITHAKTQTDVLLPNWRRMYWPYHCCRRSQYFSLACFLNLWWHIILWFSTGNVLHIGPLTCNDRLKRFLKTLTHANAFI